ncbi:MAG: nickel-binding protein [Chthoniobacterales bacterium]
MPLFIDRHNVDGVTPEALAEAHARDLAVQDNHGTKYLKYWHDQSRGCAFCLVDAPNREAAIQVHREAHGLLAEQIMEVDPNTVRAFLGDFEQGPAVMESARPNGAPVDSAFRAILFTDLAGSTAMTGDLGDEHALGLLRKHNAIVREKLNTHAGWEVKHTGDGFLASFASVASAVDCAIAIQRAFEVSNRQNGETPLQVRIGLSAGEPVAEDNDLFGATVQLAARLCAHAEPEQIMAPSVVRELCLGKKLPFKHRGERELKGFITPVDVYEVEWSQGADA